MSAKEANVRAWTSVFLCRYQNLMSFMQFRIADFWIYNSRSVLISHPTQLPEKASNDREMN